MSKYDEFPTKPDYEAKYKALEQAVKDALTEIEGEEMRYANMHLQDDTERGIEIGYERSKDILTDKTGISA